MRFLLKVLLLTYSCGPYLPTLKILTATDSLVLLYALILLIPGRPNVTLRKQTPSYDHRLRSQSCFPIYGSTSSRFSCEFASEKWTSHQ